MHIYAKNSLYVGCYIALLFSWVKFFYFNNINVCKFLWFVVRFHHFETIVCNNKIAFYYEFFFSLPLKMCILCVCTFFGTYGWTKCVTEFYIYFLFLFIAITCFSTIFFFCKSDRFYLSKNIFMSESVFFFWT